MVGAMLAKVLSKTKMASTKTSANILDEKFDYPHIGTGDISNEDLSQEVSQPTKHISTTKVTAISFADDAKAKPLNLSSISPSARKQSYASVNEDSEVPQSFTTRKPLYETDYTQTIVTQCEGISRPWDVEDVTHEYSNDRDESAIMDSEDETSSIDDQVIRSPASLETMPDEILDHIFSLITLNPDTDRYLDPKVDLFSLLFVSKSVHAAALRVLYRHVKVPQSKAFFKIHNSLLEDARLGDLVQCLDFSHYSSIGFGRARSTNNVTHYLTPTTLKAFLDRTTNLRAFLVHEHVDDELDIMILAKLFRMPSLQVLDLCSCSSTPFTKSFTDVCTKIPSGPEDFLSIKRLSLHECTTLPSQVFEKLLPRLKNLTHLDVAHTMINDKALMSIPATARITHLNLERCNQITGEAVVEFLTTHPAAKDTIVYLNIQADSSRYRLLSEEDLHDLLPFLPACLRSLNLGGARINNTHVNDLRRIATHVEELGLKGADLSLSTDIRQILSLDKKPVYGSQHSVRYLDLTDIKTVNQMSLTYSPTTVVESVALPLEVIELGESVRKDIIKRSKNDKNPDWNIRELGRRGWYVRQHHLSDKAIVQDDGHRSWKMGARWWGMRKIPVYEQATGGMYGYFMFKRA